MKYKPSRDIPQFARELKTLSPSKIRDYILIKRNEKITSESITMWFKRHADVEEQLRKELIQVSPTTAREEVNPSIFENGQFEELETVKNWINEMKDRDIAPDVIKDKVRVLKRVCKGKFSRWNVDLVNEGVWCLKHPDRLTLDECREVIRLLKDRGLDTHTLRIPLRDFLTSKGFVVGKKIAGGKARSFRKFADLKVHEEKLMQMLNELKTINYEAYLVNKFMYKTGTRIEATLDLQKSDFNVKKTHAEVKVFDKARKSLLLTEEEIKRQGKKWIKFIDAPFANELLAFGQTEKIFNIQAVEMRQLNSELINRYCPEVIKQYGSVMPNHFWRHMFAQINLERTQWNYSVVAFLGGWDVKSLQESYGKPPEEKLREWGIQHISMVV